MPCSTEKRYVLRAEIMAQRASATGAVAMHTNGKCPLNKWWRTLLRLAPSATVQTFILSRPLDSGEAGDGAEAKGEGGDITPHGFGGGRLATKSHESGCAKALVTHVIPLDIPQVTRIL